MNKSILSDSYLEDRTHANDDAYDKFITKKQIQFKQKLGSSNILQSLKRNKEVSKS
jgi:hypothetical protein